MTNDKTPKTPETPESTPNKGIQDFVLKQTAPLDKVNIINNSQSGGSVDTRSFLGLSPETDSPTGLPATNKLTTPSLRPSSETADQKIAPNSGGVSMPGDQNVGSTIMPAIQARGPGGGETVTGQPFGTPSSAGVGDTRTTSKDLPVASQAAVNPFRVEQVNASGAPQVRTVDRSQSVDSPDPFIANKTTGQQKSLDQNAGVRKDNGAVITGDVPALTAGQPSERTQLQGVAATPSLSTARIDMVTNAEGNLKITKTPADLSSNDASQLPQVANDNNSPDRGSASRGAQQEFLGQPKPNSTTEANLARTSVSGEPVVGQNQTRSTSSERSEPSVNPLKTNPGVSSDSANVSRQSLANPADNATLSRQNSANPLDGQNQSKVFGTPVDTQNRSTVPAGSLDASGRPNPQAVFDSQGRQNLPGSSLDVQGRQNLPTGAPDAQGKQTAAGASNDALDQTRRETGLQLPETKQSSGRTESSGISNSDPTRLNTGRNDANTAKIPDSKTLAGLDQKFGDKLNPPAGGRGDIPIVMPGAPDILGGLRGIGQKADAKDGKEVKGEVKDGKDSKLDTKSPAGESKGDTKSGVTSTDDKIAAQKGLRPDAENATKETDAKPSPDGRPNSSDGKPGQDGRAAEGKQQGGSNLVHDGGTTSGLTVQPGSRSEGPFVLPPGSLPVPDLVGGIRNIGQQIDARTGKPVQVDAANQGVGKQPEKGDVVKGNVSKDNAIKGAGIKGDGIKGDVSKVDPTKTPFDGVKTVVTGGVRTGDVKPGDAKPVDSKLIDGIAAAITGAVRIGDVRTGADKPVDAKTGDGVKTVVTGGANTGDGVKTAVTGGATTGDGKGADGKPIAARNPLADKSDAAIVVPPSVVPLNQMIGNLKAIAERIFPPESRGIKSDVFDNFLPGRRTEKLEGDRTQFPTSANVRPESAIPIIRSIDGQISKGDEQFVIKLPHDKGGAQAKPDKTNTVTGDLLSDKVSAKAGDMTTVAGRTKTDAIAGEPKSDALPPWEIKVDKTSPARDVKADDKSMLPAGHQQVEKHDSVVHEDAAERLLVNLELVGTVESVDSAEVEEEEVFPLAAIEYFGRDFEKTISDEDEVSFDGEAIAAADEENRYQYVVEAGDTIELIAIKTLNNVALAPLIYDINKDAIPIGMQDGRMVFTMKPGTIIWLPFPKEVKAYLNQLGGQMPNS
jgi:hypothetical protein